MNHEVNTWTLMREGPYNTNLNSTTFQPPSSLHSCQKEPYKTKAQEESRLAPLVRRTFLKQRNMG